MVEVIHLSDVKRSYPLRWGQWRLVADTHEMEHDDAPWYGVDVDRCVTAAETLDWIVQLARKSWCSSKDVGDFVRALDQIADGLQGAVCPFGRSRRVNMRVLVDEYLEEAAGATGITPKDNPD